MINHKVVGAVPAQDHTQSKEVYTLSWQAWCGEPRLESSLTGNRKQQKLLAGIYGPSKKLQESIQNNTEATYEQDITLRPCITVYMCRFNIHSPQNQYFQSSRQNFQH